MARIKAFLSGILIGLSGLLYVACSNKTLAPFLFSLGLISIIILSLDLYTGKVAYVGFNLKEILYLMRMLFYNAIGAVLVGIVGNTLYDFNISELVLNKISQPWYSTLIRSMFCGMCIYLAVELYKSTRNIITIILPVAAFIICGFEHCIANTFYFAMNFSLSWSVIIHLLISVVGNSIGSIVLHRLRYSKCN